MTNEIFSHLAAAFAPVPPPPPLRQRLLDRLAAAPVAELRAGEGEWIPLDAPGVAWRLLYRDPATRQRTGQLRLAPGAVLPAHPHRTNEQCLILEGAVTWDGVTYRAGDFVVMPAGGHHPPAESAEGALVLVIGG
jgi:quercetin dioxygenase-like cupin family protein